MVEWVVLLAAPQINKVDLICALSSLFFIVHSLNSSNLIHSQYEKGPPARHFSLFLHPAHSEELEWKEIKEMNERGQPPIELNKNTKPPKRSLLSLCTIPDWRLILL